MLEAARCIVYRDLLLALLQRTDGAVDRDELAARVTRLESRREALGKVNPLAKEEYEREKERLTELRVQRADLEEENPEDPDLFGLYHGVPLPERGDASGLLPDKISIYRVPLEESFDDPEELREATLDLAAMLFATGLDPQRSTVFCQSSFPVAPSSAMVLSVGV